MPVLPAAPVDWMLRPVHRWIWGDHDRRVRKLLTFGEVETDGGRDILRAAEMTPDPLLRRLYLEHAIDELRHGDMFRRRGAALPGYSTAARCPADTVSRIWRSTASPTAACWRSSTSPRKPPPAGSRSIARWWTTIRRRARSSRRSCATRSFT
jgi:hypothetical protein